MHIQLLNILDQWVAEAIIRFTKLPIYTTAYNAKLPINLLEQSKIILTTYINLLKAVHILPTSIQNYKGHLFIKHTLSGFIPKNGNITLQTLEIVHNQILHYLMDHWKHKGEIIPIHLRYVGPKEIYLLTGISYIESETPTAQSILHLLFMPTHIIDFGTYKLDYLSEILKLYQDNQCLSVRQFCIAHKKSYKQFLKDSKDCFGMTFREFFPILKMMNVLADLLLTDCSMKEIVTRNDFADYSNMHRIFYKNYNFPLKDIPRLRDIL